MKTQIVPEVVTRPEIWLHFGGTDSVATVELDPDSAVPCSAHEE